MNPVISLSACLMLACVLITPSLGYAGAQQNKMKTCNAEADAKGLGAIRVDGFMVDKPIYRRSLQLLDEVR